MGAINYVLRTLLDLHVYHALNVCLTCVLKNACCTFSCVRSSVALLKDPQYGVENCRQLVHNLLHKESQVMFDFDTDWIHFEELLTFAKSQSSVMFSDVGLNIRTSVQLQIFQFIFKYPNSNLIKSIN